MNGDLEKEVLEILKIMIKIIARHKIITIMRLENGEKNEKNYIN